MEPFKTRTHPENLIVRESIFTALMQLMETKHFSEISVTEITKRAGVSRMAYYRNFHDKQEILFSHLDALFEAYWNELHAKPQDDYQLACLYFAYFRENRLFLEHLLKNDLSQFLLERHDLYLRTIFKDLYHNLTIDRSTESYTISFFSGGLFKLLIDWTKNGMA